MIDSPTTGGGLVTLGAGLFVAGVGAWEGA